MRVERLASPDAADRSDLKVEGCVTISEAARFKDVLLDALGAARELRVDLSGVTEIDLAGLQLLCAAHRSARERGKVFSVQGGEDGIYGGIIEVAGFRRHIGCFQDSSCACIFVGGDS
jgi:ABC-type transporter Mla MlaB component